NPYPGLIRLLEHSDDLIPGYAIFSIFLILEAGSNTTSDSEPHPHYETFQVCDGIKKIFDLFQKNRSKFSRERSALCLGFLFKSHEIADPIMRHEIINYLKYLLYDPYNWVKEKTKDALKFLAQNETNRFEILNNFNLNAIADCLKIDFQGSIFETQEITKMQEARCLLIYSILYGREDLQIRRDLVNAGIVDALLHIFSSRLLESITRPYTQAFLVFTYPSNIDLCLLLIEKSPFYPLLRLFDHKDENVVRDAIVSINNILYCTALGTELTQQHPQYKDIDFAGGIVKIYSLFKRTANELIKVISAICFGIVFRSQEIKDSTMKKDIIADLKSKIEDPQEDIRKLGEIESGDFTPSE
ncbi:MAG: hypothetical protein EZS28_034980, partial [Streblomastix strix]